jgi:hypothetical protein
LNSCILRRRRTRNALRFTLGIYLGVLVLLGVLQTKLIYFPVKADEPILVKSARRLNLVPWRNGQGEIMGWRRPEADSRAASRLLVFHGNAGYALMRNHFRIGFERLEHGRLWEVVLFEYPGYGARKGKPSEAAINAGAEEALEQLEVEDNRPIYAVGESLGSGPASYLAGKFPGKVSGLFLITPFSSLPDVASYHYPILPVRLLMRDRFDNVAALSHYDGPVAMLLAGRDRIVPPGLGRKLFENYCGPKIIRTLEESDHNQIDFSPRAGWWQLVSSFLLAEL